MKGKKYLGLLLAVLLFASEAQAREDVTVTVGGETVPAFVGPYLPDRLGGDRPVHPGRARPAQLCAGRRLLV